MAKHAWPTAVTSWEDTVKFAQLLFGTGVRVENYGERLPHHSNQSFLLFAKGGCKAPKAFSEIGKMIPDQLCEIEDFTVNVRGNGQNPLKTQQIGKGRVYYHSCQVTRDPCSCRTNFGADAQQNCIPTTSSLWRAGDKFAKLFDATLHANFQAFGASMKPVWFRKSWQLVWNMNNHNEKHYIDPHQDESKTYWHGDPITSFSFGHGGVLTLSSVKKQFPGKMLFQEDGDALIMAGKFQSEFFHGVPARETWKFLCDGPMFGSMQEWEKQGLRREVELHATCDPAEKHVRYNCTLRWHHTHQAGCAEYKAEPVQTEIVSRPVLDGNCLASGSSSVAAASGSSSVGSDLLQRRFAGFKKSPQMPGADLPGQASAAAGNAASIFSGTGSRQQRFVGLKERPVETEGETTDPRAAESQKIVVVLLDCLGNLVDQCDLLWGVLKFMPLVDVKPKHIESLRAIEQSAMQHRNELMRASEAVAEFGVDVPTSVNYQSLNLMALATQQCREIQQAFDAVRIKEGCWVKEIDCPLFCNCLRDDVSWRKLLLTHQQFEDLLAYVDSERTEREQELSVNMRWLPANLLPAHVSCAMRHPNKAKQHASEELGMDTYDLSYGWTLKIKGFEMGFCKEMKPDSSNGKRLLLQHHLFGTVADQTGVIKMVAEVKYGFRKCLQHLRTLDAEREFVDLHCGHAVDENYYVWVWAQSER